MRIDANVDLRGVVTEIKATCFRHGEAGTWLIVHVGDVTLKGRAEHVLETLRSVVAESERAIEAGDDHLVADEEDV